MLIRQLQTSRNLKERFYTADLFYKDYRLHSNFFLIKFQNFTNKPHHNIFPPPFFLLGDKEFANRSNNIYIYMKESAITSVLVLPPEMTLNLIFSDMQPFGA